MGAGAPNRPLPPTPDEDANERTLIMKRVRPSIAFSFEQKQQNTHFHYLLPHPMARTRHGGDGTR